MSREAEIVVIGAGMVGAAFACLLAEQGDEISIAVLDIREPAIFDAGAVKVIVGASSRPESLTKNDVRLVQSLARPCSSMARACQ